MTLLLFLAHYLCASGYQRGILRTYWWSTASASSDTGNNGDCYVYLCKAFVFQKQERSKKEEQLKQEAGVKEMYKDWI